MVGRSKGEEGERKAPSKHYFANLKNQLIEFNDEVSTYADILKSLCLLSVVSVKGTFTFPAVHHTPPSSLLSRIVFPLIMIPVGRLEEKRAPRAQFAPWPSQ